MSVILENETCRLSLSEKGYAESLTLKATGEECVSVADTVPFFSVTQPRPFNNEIKLAHPNKRTTYPADRIRAEKTETGVRLTVGFALAPYEAVVDVTVAPRYFRFTLSSFTVPPEAYPGLAMTPPPVEEFRLIGLPVPHRVRFGEWLNVSWDDGCAVCVLAADPYPRIESEPHRDYRVLTADAERQTKLIGTSAALICTPSAGFLDAVDEMERGCGLPRGVESRRSDAINASIYWTGNCTPENVDEHIRYARAGGFRMMLLYYTCIFRSSGYSLNGDYEWSDAYPNGWEDVRRMLDKIRAAGITPGFHFLQTHIGLNSSYCTPEADPRLGKVRRFTLAQAVGEADTTLTVEEDPTGSVLHPRCRILQFGGELISYESYTTQRPYRFLGCVRGANGTTIRSHPRGEVGGLLDVSEFGATSCYIDQNTSLQDEIADKLAAAYSAGFRFCYFDGSEGTSEPYAFHVPMAQYRVWRKFDPPPLFTEGAAKAHFSWHHLSGGNAFDIFPPSVFKEMIGRYPAEEAPRMRQDFTRLNFGWWGFWAPQGRSDGGTQADLVEYGTSRAAAWDCPVTVQTRLDAFRTHPRLGDIMEVFRRWEDVRARHWLTEEQKAALRDLTQEHVLLLNSAGEYELTEYEELRVPDRRLRVYLFTRQGKSVAVFWHTEGEAALRLPLCGDAVLTREIDREPLPCTRRDGALILPVGDRAYLTAEVDRGTLADAFLHAELC